MSPTANRDPLVPGNVVVVDDERNITLVMQAMLERAGFRVRAYNDGAQALARFEDEGLEDVDLVVSDLSMPGAGGMDLLAWCQRNYPRLPVVIVTAFGTVEAAVAALKQGAFDFITKPFDQTELLNVCRKAVATHRGRQEEPTAPAIEAVAAPGAEAEGAISSIIGASPQMQEVFRVIGKIAGSSATVLITGESGTGKELVAYEIHRRSPRAAKPFIKINCAAIPSTLIESELFGYERGAFTGAVTSKPGRFELAHEGTIFLDEIGEMPLEMQVKLLRVLQEQEFERVGGVSSIRTDVRILTATNRDLEAEVKAGRFREDLFYRLNVVPIRLPALRERRDDIDLLVRHFLGEFARKLGRTVTGLDPRALEALRAAPWPGNIRQLENALERTVLMSEGPTLQLSDLPAEILAAAGVSAGGTTAPAEDGELSFKEIVRARTQSVERELIEQALESTGGNVTRAAEKLGLSRKGLQLKLKELGIQRHGF
jgi:two-component system response regulator AtoC